MVGEEVEVDDLLFQREEEEEEEEVEAIAKSLIQGPSSPARTSRAHSSDSPFLPTHNHNFSTTNTTI